MLGKLLSSACAVLSAAAILDPCSAQTASDPAFADLEFHADADPSPDASGGHTVHLYWNNPGRNTYKVQASSDLQTWATVFQGYVWADDAGSLPVYITAPALGAPPPKPLRTVSLRQTTDGWFASWVDIVENEPVWCLQSLAVPPPEFDGYIYSTETPARRLVFTQFRVSDPSSLLPPPWSDVSSLPPLPLPAQTTFLELVAALQNYQQSAGQATPPIPPPDPNSERTFYRVQILTDSDGDGLSDAEELNVPDGPGGQPLHTPPLNTDPFDQDSDHDGIPDGDEVAGGSDPLDPNSRPPIVGDQLVLDVRHREFAFGFWPSFSPTQDSLSWVALQAPDTAEPSLFSSQQAKPSQSPTPDEVVDFVRELEPYEPAPPLPHLDPHSLPVPFGQNAALANVLFSNRPADTESFMYGSESRVYLRIASRRTEDFRHTIAFMTTAQRNGVAEPTRFVSETFIIPKGRWKSASYDIPVYIPNGAWLGSSYQVGDDGSTRSRTEICPIEISVPDPTTLQANRSTAPDADPPALEYKPAASLNIATWENSFTHDSSEDLVTHWITNDVDHFRIRFRRPDKAGRGSITISLETVNPGKIHGVENPAFGNPAYSDAANDVSLKEIPNDPGIFENTFMLVSDEVDDQYDGTDESLQDRTHRIAVGGELIVRHEGVELKRLTVPEVGHIRLRPFVLWYDRTLGWTPAVSDSVVAADVEDIRKRFAQAGLTVDWDGKPWGIDVTKVPGASANFRSNGPETVFDDGPTSDETVLSDYIKSQYSNSVDAAKDIIIVYADLINEPDNSGFWSQNRHRAYTIRPSFATGKAVQPMIITAKNRHLHTMAHEVLHMLLNDTHHPGSHDIEFGHRRRLWSGGPDLGDEKDRKRMSKKELNTVVPHIQNSTYIRK